MNDIKFSEEAFKNFGFDLLDTIEKHVDKLDVVPMSAIALTCFLKLLKEFMSTEDIKKFTDKALSEALKERNDG